GIAPSLVFSSILSQMLPTSSGETLVAAAEVEPETASNGSAQQIGTGHGSDARQKIRLGGLARSLDGQPGSCRSQRATEVQTVFPQPPAGPLLTRAVTFPAALSTEPETGDAV